MPTILRIKGFRFFFFSLEGNEPPHVHIEQDDKVAKFWLSPYKALRSHELTGVRAIMLEHREKFLEKWNEHFSR